MPARNRAHSTAHARSVQTVARAAHEVNVKGLVGDGSQRVDDERPDRDVRHEAAVHHVHVHPVAARLVDVADL